MQNSISNVAFYGKILWVVFLVFQVSSAVHCLDLLLLNLKCLNIKNTQSLCYLFIYLFIYCGASRVNEKYQNQTNLIGKLKHVLSTLTKRVPEAENQLLNFKIFVWVVLDPEKLLQDSQKQARNQIFFRAGEVL